MKSVKWRDLSRNDTTLIAVGYADEAEALEAAQTFCFEESIPGSRITCHNAYTYPDDPGVFYFQTECTWT